MKGEGEEAELATKVALLILIAVLIFFFIYDIWAKEKLAQTFCKIPAAALEGIFSIAGYDTIAFTRICEAVFQF